jgi:hypothetical protein
MTSSQTRLTPRGMLKDCHHENFHLFSDSFLLSISRQPIIRARAGQFTGCRDQLSRITQRTAHR